MAVIAAATLETPSELPELIRASVTAGGVSNDIDVHILLTK